MRKSLIALSLCVALCLCGCGSKRITVPYSSDDCAGKAASTVQSDFQAVGFTDITLTPKDTASLENSDGSFCSIEIGDGVLRCTGFKDTSTFPSDDKIVITYYHSTVPAPTPEPEPEPTPEPSAEPEAMPVDKETAIMLDAALAGVTAGMEEEYNSFLSSFASGDISSNLSAYNTAKSLSAVLSTTCNTLLTSKTLDNDEYISYVCAVVEYGYAMQAVADDTMVYIDDGKTSSLSAVQDAISAAQKPMLAVATTRLAFLQAAGCTADEIDDILEG